MTHLSRPRPGAIAYGPCPHERRHAQELIEAITHLAFYSGWPNAVTALGVGRDVFNAETQPRQ